MRKYVHVWCAGEIVLFVTWSYWGAVNYVKEYAEKNGYKNVFCARVEYKEL